MACTNERGILVALLLAALGCGRQRRVETQATNDGASARFPAPASTRAAASLPSETAAIPSVGAIATAEAGTDLTDTWRDYRGTLGDKTSIEMFLERQGPHVSGDYRYVSIGRDLWLRGNAEADGTLDLTEHVEQSATGSFKLRPDAEGGLIGTWSDPGGARTLPVKLAPRGVPRAGRTTFMEFLDRMARMEKKVPLPLATLESAVVGTENFWIREDRKDTLFEHGVYFDYATLYVADVNNDGTPDLVFVDTNSVSIHNDQLRGIYDAEGPGLRELPFAEASSHSLYDGGDLGPNFPVYRDHPFIETTPSGVVMRMTNRWGVDEHGDVVRMTDPCDRMFNESFVFLWKGARVDLLEHTRKYTPCR